ncbi:hypothetical protein N9L48_00955 [Psychrosphaera sp.]|nr:hypothetical protein [Psychrosphaera sp.]
MAQEKQHNTTNSINDLEKLVWHKRYTDAEHCIIKLIDSHSKGKVNFDVAPFDRHLSDNDDDIESYQIIEKLAATITQLFVDPNYTPSEMFFKVVCLKRDYLTNLFSASSYHSTDHILDSCGLIGKSDYTKSDLQRIMLAYTIESTIQLPWQGLVSFLPNQTADLLNGLFANFGIQLSHRASLNIKTILDSVEHFPVIQASKLQGLSPLIRSYFNCSFLPYTNKYELKKYIIKTFVNYLSKSLSDPIFKKLSQVKAKLPKNIKTSNRLKIVFVHEHYRNKHAMFRCWHHMFCAISSEYETVAFGLNIDELAGADFDRYHNIEEAWDVNLIIERVLDEKPDIIIYPSIGMSPYVPLMSILRMAPLQIACGGHPSSSYSDEIDYYLWEDNVSEKVMNNILTEKFLPYKSQFSPVTLVEIEKRDTSLELGKVHIAINGVIQKVSNDLLKACKNITNGVEQPVQFHFFMSSATQDLEYFAAKSIIRRLLPNAKVHPYGDYSEYMNTLSQCRFAIGTVPFGGSNSNIDLLRLAVPKLFVTDESDLPGLTDRQLWQSFDILEGECKSLEELVEKAKQWLVDDNLLDSITLRMKSERISELLHECETHKATDKRLLPALAHAIREKSSR